MTVIRNLSHSPFDIQTADGPKILPVGGEMDAEFDPAYLEMMKAAGSVEVVEVAEKKKRGLGKKGG